MTRTQEIQSKLLSGIEEEERLLFEAAAQQKQRYDNRIAEVAKAKKERPGLQDKLEGKRKLLERLTNEIQSLEEQVATAENLCSDTGVGYLSITNREKQDYESKLFKAENFVSSKVKELTKGN
jgi:hypothetical protein